MIPKLRYNREQQIHHSLLIRSVATMTWENDRDMGIKKPQSIFGHMCDFFSLLIVSKYSYHLKGEQTTIITQTHNRLYPSHSPPKLSGLRALQSRQRAHF